MRTVDLGISTIAIGSPDDLTSADLAELPCLELCGYAEPSLPALERFAAAYRGRIGLHCPLPFDGWAKRFDISGPESDAHTEALDLVARTLRTARQLAAEYIVVHFPSVDPTAASSSRGFDTAVDAAIRVVGMGRDAGVRVLLENVGPNPYVSTGRELAAVLLAVEGRTGIRPEVCFDPGHVHTREGDVMEFARGVAPWVTSVHFYNAQRGSRMVGWHAPATPDQAPDAGWIDWRSVLGALAAMAPLQQLIVEHSCCPELGVALAWARSLLGDHPLLAPGLPGSWTGGAPRVPQQG